MREIVIKFFDLYDSDPSEIIFFVGVGYFIVYAISVQISYKLSQKYKPELARLINFWLWETPLGLGLFYLAHIIIFVIIFGIIFGILSWIFPSLVDSIWVNSILAISLAISIIILPLVNFFKFNKYIEGPHWYKIKYIKLHPSAKCPYRLMLTKQGLDNYQYCKGIHDCHYCRSVKYDEFSGELKKDNF